jgi:hypothetical protein
VPRGWFYRPGRAPERPQDQLPIEAQSLCLSDSAAFALNNFSIINARARIPHTKDRRVPAPGTLQCNIVNACYFGKDFGMRRRAEQRSASAERCSALQIRLRLRRSALPEAGAALRSLFMPAPRNAGLRHAPAA